MLDNLTQAEAGIIGLDIIFAEEDKTSPAHIVQNLGLDPQQFQEISRALNIKTKELVNYDDVLAQSIATTPTILGYIFDFDKNNTEEAPEIPAIFIEKSYPGEEFLLSPKGVLLNIASIQEQAYSSGYLNNVPDASGMVRSVPLLMKFDDSIYPSLAFEMVRIALSSNKVLVRYNETGVEQITAGELSIPTDRFGRLHVNFKGPAKTYRYISAIDIINNSFDAEDVKGKLILVGTSAYGLMDLRATPLDSVMPGVEIHANVIDNILSQQMLYKPDWAEGANLLLIILLTAFIILVLSYLPLWFGGTILGALVPLVLYSHYLLLFEHYIILNIVFPLVSIVFAGAIMIIIKYFFEQRQKEMIKGKFSQKVSPQVMEDLIRQEGDGYLNTRNENVTVYFSDIRSFTVISEQLESPERLVEFLNYYMTKMADSIVESKGTIDKFIGDAIMAYWNAPGRVENHADKAVQTALKQIGQREELNQYMLDTYDFELDYGIGLNTGLVTIGDIGSKGRSDYTIIGDPVNLAARLEGLCKYYGVRLIISEFTKSELQDEYVMRELDWVKVKGKTEPVRIYEVISLASEDVMSIQVVENYNRALELFREEQFEKALVIFNELNEEKHHNLYQLYIERCQYLIDNDIHDFDGVFEFDFK